MVYEVLFIGKWLSINEAYSSNRWKRTAVKNDYKTTFKNLIRDLNIKRKINTYTIDVEYWSRLDSLNLCAGIKIFEDCLKEEECIIDDDKRYQKGISITPNEDLKHNTYIIRINVISFEEEKIKMKK